LVLSAFNGIISTVVILIGVAFVAPLFSTLTFYQFLELGNPNHPLLMRLATQAPGTYHHSLLVSQLVEVAAKRIGANEQFAKVCALYHDIGKLKNPDLFIENQKGVNPHEKLSPQVSAQKIISHVVSGIEIAKEYNLPNEVIESIPAHHGTMKTRYFYDLALRSKGKTNLRKNNATLDEILLDETTSNDNESLERKFTYPGPKPKSKEHALIMIADGVEASVRALVEKTEDKVKAVINTIIKERITDGQLDDCSISFKELKAVRTCFLEMLRSIYHFRVSYDPPLGEAKKINGTKKKI
jgi:putative nucleotidyltransferase with HDIG domain